MTGEDPYVVDGVLVNKLGFREGNGRSQRALFRQLAQDAGWRIAWSELDAVENNTASAAALQGDTRPLTHMLEGIVRPW